MKSGIHPKHLKIQYLPKRTHIPSHVHMSTSRGYVVNGNNHYLCWESYKSCKTLYIQNAGTCNVKAGSLIKAICIADILFISEYTYQLIACQVLSVQLSDNCNNPCLISNCKLPQVIPRHNWICNRVIFWIYSLEN